MVLALLLTTTNVSSQPEEPAPPFVETAQAQAKRLQTSLQERLKSAVRSGGLVQAIEVCHDSAPDIAKTLSNTSGWTIGRTSLKYRNPSNKPTAQELAVLKLFEQKKATGTNIDDLEWWQETDGYRFYMKAIPTKPVCLGCHGQAISPSVDALLKELYPEDAARGYRVNTIRGAFTLKQKKPPREVE